MRNTQTNKSATSDAMQRADELLRQMTIEEKVMQLSSVFPLGLFNTEGTNHSQLDALLKDGIGHVSALGLIGHKTPEVLAKAVNAIQRYLVTETRLKIPAIFHNEAMSGVVAPHFTAFPTSIALAATWDPTAVEEMSDIIRRQMRSVGMLQALAPVMDVARDARWGRVSETYGEDPYLVSAMSVAFTRGLQGEDLTEGVLATAKHFIGYAEYIKSNYAAVSLAEAVRQLLPKAEVTVVAGTGVVPKEPTDIPAAVAAARNADLVILAIGGRSAWSHECTEGEGSDTANKDLPPQQVELINAVTALGKPTVAVISMEGPYALTSVIDKLPAVLTDYYGGPYQGTAIAEAIFGVTNPGGKLPITLPRHVGQMPIHYAQKWGSGYRRTRDDIHHGYLDMLSTPLFPFGHGLSYTTFKYSELELHSDTVGVNDELQLSLSVTNTGSMRGTEVVQLYVSDTATGVTLPAQQLVGFVRVDLDPGESKDVAFRIPMSLLGYTGLSGDFVIEPGPVEVSAGSSSDDIRCSAKFTITGGIRVTKSEEREFLSETSIGTEKADGKEEERLHHHENA